MWARECSSTNKGIWRWEASIIKGIYTIPLTLHDSLIYCNSISTCNCVQIHSTNVWDLMRSLQITSNMHAIVFNNFLLRGLCLIDTYSDVCMCSRVWNAFLSSTHIYVDGHDCTVGSNLDTYSHHTQIWIIRLNYSPVEKKMYSLSKLNLYLLFVYSFIYVFLVCTQRGQ